MNDTVVCRPVARVHCRFTEVTGMPIQSAAVPQELARIEVLAEFAAGLRDIEGFEYLLLFTHFHRCASEKLELTPFLDDHSHGVFATRAPARPNRLGLSIVQLLKVDGTTLHIAGNDMLDGTPILDIKPYVPRFDVRTTERIGWFADRLDALPTIRADDRMA